MSRNIYVASSWRNTIQPELVKLLRDDGHEVYDFRDPAGGTGFSWRETLPDYDPSQHPAYDPRAIREKGTDWVPAPQYLEMISHPRAHEGFKSDKQGMLDADTMVMVLPCGKSAHLEIGWAMGRGLDTVILLEDPVEPELMYKFADLITSSVSHMRRWLLRED